MGESDRRKFPRASKAMMVRVTFDDGRSMDAELVDVTAEGVALQLEQPLEAAVALQLTFEGDDELRASTVNGRVLRTTVDGEKTRVAVSLRAPDDGYLADVLNLIHRQLPKGEG